jgi:short-subunit dehydrogenase
VPLFCIFAAMKRAIVIGASSGIGRQVAQLLIQNGWHVGLGSRRIELIDELKAMAPDRVYTASIDVTNPNATKSLLSLIDKLGGMGLYIHVAGIGFQNAMLDEEKELSTLNTNVVGFSRMVGEAFRFFASHAGGHIVVVSSIAGTKGMGAAAAYSCSKAFQSAYTDALQQISASRNLHIQFTDVRPGFVDTELLASSNGRFPMMISSRKAAKSIIKAVYKKKRVTYIDWRWRIVAWLWRWLPLSLWRRFDFFTIR